MSPDRKKTKTLLYVSEISQSTTGVVDVYSVPKYLLVGQITAGIDWPLGLTIDRKGKLYVTNLDSKTVTVYQAGQTSPSLTLSVLNPPTDVAVGSNGYVYVSDQGGGVGVYPPGATSPSRRLTNPNLDLKVGGVAVSSSNNVYADGESYYSYYYDTPAVVEFRNARGTGTNLGLTGLSGALAGVIIDDGHLTVSDFGGSTILIYPPGQTSPSVTITVPYNPERSAINRAENEIYVPLDYAVGVYDYPSGKFVTEFSTGGNPTGAALSPAANH
jgi:hypothetical protein